MARKRKKNVKISDLKASPFRHEGLTPEQEAMAREAWKLIKDAEVFDAFEEFESGFLRDMHPERELAVWLRIAKRYREHIDAHPDADKKQVLGQMVLGSM